MGQTLVYNTGKAEVADEEKEVTFGIFIDGTLNNKANTKLRYKVEGKVDPLHEQGEATTATEQEKKTFDERTDTKNWFYRFLDIGGYGGDTSYHNDYTNVARMWFCTNEEYRIYIEGMGTDDFAEDASDGYAFGSGPTGVRGKVRKGCKKLAKKIADIIKIDRTQILTQITVDIFGFSRGATSARNMAYEIRKAAYPARKASIPDGYYPINPYSQSGMPTPKFKQAIVDQDGLEVDPKMLVDGFLPKYGYLGYCLLQNEITLEELNQLTIVIRVLGVYDTVSSYYEAGDSLGTYKQDGSVVDENLAWKGIKKTVKGKNPFSQNEEELNLHSFGYVQQVVHFTAKDEHRANFALTRIKGAGIIDRIIEKNFPGVHCDIGGAYDTGEEKKMKIAQQTVLLGIIKGTLGYCRLKSLKKQLLKEHWFKNQEEDEDDDKEENDNNDDTTKDKANDTMEDQLWISSTLTKIVLSSKRFLKKEYSYIPLQFMEEYCRKTSMADYFSDTTEAKFNIDEDEILVDAKKYLKPYVMNEPNAKEWEFIPDDILEERKKKREEQEILDEKLLKIEQTLKNPPVHESTYDNINPDQYKPQIIELKTENKEVIVKQEDRVILLDEVVVTAYSSQGLLRVLRNKYLHWSADHLGVGLEGRKNREREEFPKMQ